MTLREIAVKIDASSELLATLSHYFVGVDMRRLAMQCEQTFCEIQEMVRELRDWQPGNGAPEYGDSDVPIEIGDLVGEFEEVSVM